MKISIFLENFSGKLEDLENLPAMTEIFHA
jgi:hypothetical protein